MRYPIYVHELGPGDSDQVLHHVYGIFKESDRFHAFPVVATTQQREEWMHHPHSDVVIDTEDSNSDGEDSVMPPLIYPYDYDNYESLSNPPSTEPTPELRSPSEKLPRNQPRNPIMMPYQYLMLPQGRILWGRYPQKT